MILPDVNVLIYAYDELADDHVKIKTWLTTVLNNEPVFLNWHTITAFLRIITNPRIFARPLKIDEAIDIVQSWISRANVEIVSLDKRSWQLYAAALRDVGATGNMVMDAHLAALAISRGAILASRDRDFRKFDGLRTLDPVKS